MSTKDCPCCEKGQISQLKDNWVCYGCGLDMNSRYLDVIVNRIEIYTDE